MADESVINKFLKQNEGAGQGTYQPRPFWTEMSSLPQTLIITCLDPRISPETWLDLGPVGPLIFRNVCGHVAPVLNDLVALDSLLHFKDVIVVHHTDCGSLMIKDENVRKFIKEELPEVQDVDNMKFGGIVDVVQSVKDDLVILQSAPLVRKELKERSYGLVLDIKTGTFSSV